MQLPRVARRIQARATLPGSRSCRDPILTLAGVQMVLDRLLGYFSNDLAIDLGTANTLSSVTWSTMLTIGAALDLVPAGGRIALAAGTYDEPVKIYQALELDHLGVVAVEELEKGGLRAGRALDATEFDPLAFETQPLEIEQEVHCPIVGVVAPVYADSGRVRQILRNLLVNARRYGVPPIRVVVRNVGEFVQVEVRKMVHDLQHILLVDHHSESFAELFLHHRMQVLEIIRVMEPVDVFPHHA